MVHRKGKFPCEGHAAGEVVEVHAAALEGGAEVVCAFSPPPSAPPERIVSALRADIVPDKTLLSFPIGNRMFVLVDNDDFLYRTGIKY